MSTLRIHAVSFALFATASFFAGCAATTSMTGKVIQGGVGFVGVVDATDERFKSDGVAGVKVTVTKNPQEGGMRIGEATTDAKGNFNVVISDQSALIRPAGIAASGPGYQPASGVMNIPPKAQRVLIIVRPAGSSGTR